LKGPTFFSEQGPAESKSGPAQTTAFLVCYSKIGILSSCTVRDSLSTFHAPTLQLEWAVNWWWCIYI